VFDQNTGQKEMFDRLGFPLVEDLLQGKNGEKNTSFFVNISPAFSLSLLFTITLTS